MSARTILPLIAVLTAFAACNRDMEPAEQKDSFAVTFTAPCATSIRASVTPSDTAAQYAAVLVLQEDAETLENADIMLRANGWLTGDTLYTATGLKPATGYVLCLFYKKNTHAAGGGLCKFPCSTTDLPLSDMKLTLAVADDSLIITPSCNDPWIFFYETLTDWQDFTHGATPSAESVTAEIEEMVAWYQHDDIPLPLHTGAWAMSLTDVSIKPDRQYIFLAAPYTEAVNGNPVWLVR